MHIDIAAILKTEGWSTIGTGDSVLKNGRLDTVQRVTVYPPRKVQPEGCPISRAMTAVQVTCEHGDRWLGVDMAFVGGDLRVHVLP